VYHHAATDHSSGNQRPGHQEMATAGLSSEAMACIRLGRDAGELLPQPPMGESRRASLVPNADKYRQRMASLKDARVGQIIFGTGLVQPVMQRRTVLKLKLLTLTYANGRLVVDLGYAQLVFLIKVYLPWANGKGTEIEREEAHTLVQYLMDLERELGVRLIPERGNPVLEVMYQTFRAHRFYGASVAELQLQLTLSGCYFRMAELVQQLSLRRGDCDPQTAWQQGGDHFIRHEIEVLMALARCRAGEKPSHVLVVTGTVPITAGRTCCIDLGQAFDNVLDDICNFAFEAVCEICDVETFVGTKLDKSFGGNGMTKMRSVFKNCATVATGGIFRAHFVGFRLDINALE
jgi:hypothetical protein